MYLSLPAGKRYVYAPQAELPDMKCRCEWVGLHHASIDMKREKNRGESLSLSLSLSHICVSIYKREEVRRFDMKRESER
jgi:hypothetical protein